MSLAGYTALLLLLVAITPGGTEDASCTFSNITATSDHYNLTIYPGTLSNATLYTVTVTSTGNESVLVLLEALETTNKTAIGTWLLGGISNCSGGPLWSITLNPNNSFITNWTSPSSIPKSVDVLVSIANTANTTVTYRLSKTLTDAPTANPTTTTVTTTNGGHASHQVPMFFTLMETFIFLVVTGKLLS